MEVQQRKSFVDQNQDLEQLNLAGAYLEKLEETRKTKRVYALMHAMLTFALQLILMIEIYIQLLGAE